MPLKLCRVLKYWNSSLDSREKVFEIEASIVQWVFIDSFTILRHNGLVNRYAGLKFARVANFISIIEFHTLITAYISSWLSPSQSTDGRKSKSEFGPFKSCDSQRREISCDSNVREFPYIDFLWKISIVFSGSAWIVSPFASGYYSSKDISCLSRNSRVVIYSPSTFYLIFISTMRRCDDSQNIEAWDKSLCSCWIVLNFFWLNSLI